MTKNKPKAICFSCRHSFKEGAGIPWLCNADRKIKGYDVIFGTPKYSRAVRCKKRNATGDCPLFEEWFVKK